jgi:GNAT superfamily N-acetyltransferase
MEARSFVVEDQPAARDLESLEDQINHYNMTQTGAFDGRALAIFVRNEQQEVVAGLSGYTWAAMCEVQFLWVHPSLRRQGYGSALLQGAELEAQQRECSIMILGTYSFQAPSFYQHHGYEIVGRVERCPLNHTNYYLSKRLPAVEETSTGDGLRDDVSSSDALRCSSQPIPVDPSVQVRFSWLRSRV